MRFPTKYETNKWIDDRIGMQYKFLGRDESGLDCLGLILLFYREMFEVELPDPIVRGQVPLHQRADMVTSMFRKVRLNDIPLGGVAYLRSRIRGKISNHCLLAVDPPRYFAQMNKDDGLHRIHVYDFEERDGLNYYALR